MLLRLGFIVVTFLTLACSDQDSYDYSSAISPELRIYFDRFESEAESRGLLIDWSAQHIYADLTQIESDAVGQCLTYEQGRNDLLIDEEYWLRSNEVNKEFLIFHELGHCVLKRGHLDAANPDGSCQSIMNSGNESCRKNYNGTTRSEYLDELFYSS